VPDHRDVYDAISETYRDRWGPQTVSAALAAFAQRVGDGVVLDAGCGPGRDLAAFAQLGVDAVGIDSSEGMVRLAVEGGACAHVGDLLDLAGFADGSFRGIWASASLVHLDDDEVRQALSELLRVSDDGAIARVTVKASGDGRHGAGEESEDAGPSRWFRWWSVEEFAAVASSAGWQVESVGYEDDSARVGLRWVVAVLIR
jgi:SAM-dependent methyltransferase